MKKRILILGSLALVALAGCNSNGGTTTNVNFGKYEDFTKEENKKNYELGRDYFKLKIANPDTTKTGEDESHFSYYLPGETVAEFDVLFDGEKSVKECLEAYDAYFDNVKFEYSTYDQGVTYYFAGATKDNVKLIENSNILVLFNNAYSNYTINNFTPAGADKKLDTKEDNLKELTIVKDAWIY